MSNFIEKLSNKIQGNDHERSGEQDSQDPNFQQRQGHKSGNIRSGQQNLSGSRNDQQFSTGSTASDQYSSQQGSGLGGDGLSRTQVRSGDVQGDTWGSSGRNQQSSGLSGQDYSTTGNTGGAYGTQEESLGSSGLGSGSGRQTRSQAAQSHHHHQASSGEYQQQQGDIAGSNWDPSSGQQGQYSQQAEELGRKGFERGVQEGQKYVDRNL